MEEMVHNKAMFAYSLGTENSGFKKARILMAKGALTGQVAQFVCQIPIR